MPKAAIEAGYVGHVDHIQGISERLLDALRR
jgi:hypothetical protein